jgi:2-amino-4-hydroxy-6-hydroxymethyldihydropteridine diphosphokinase
VNNSVYPNNDKIELILSLGANLGDRYKTLLNAVDLIGNCLLTSNLKMSSVYETEPIGILDQPNFLNMAVFGTTQFTYFEVINLIKSIEYLLSRKKRERWHEREIDIDIVFYGKKIINIPMLTIPHKEMTLRKFVLIPLSEICPDFIHPVLNKSVKQLLEECTDNSEIYLFQKH